MKAGQTRYCARSRCQKPFTVCRGDLFLTCPACRLPWLGGDMGATQQLSHARERKGMHNVGEPNLHLELGDPNEVVI